MLTIGSDDVTARDVSLPGPIHAPERYQSMMPGASALPAGRAGTLPPGGGGFLGGRVSAAKVATPKTSVRPTASTVSITTFPDTGAGRRAPVGLGGGGSGRRAPGMGHGG